jgi:TPR repeat protein
MGHGTEQSDTISEQYFQVAMRLLLKSVTEKDPDPQLLFDLGVMFSSGYGCENNDHTAFQYFEKGAGQGD